MTRTLPSASPRTETLSNRAAAYNPERESVAAPLVCADAFDINVLIYPQSVGAVGVLAQKLIAEISHKPENHINQRNRRFLESRRLRRMSVSERPSVRDVPTQNCGIP